MLGQVNSPFLNGERGSIEDLSVAVLICSQPWRESQRTLRKWWLPLYVWIWKHIACRKIDIRKEKNAFLEYLDGGLWFPDANEHVGKGRELKSPGLFRLIAKMCSEFNLTPDAALDMPMSFANALYAAADDLAGKIDLYGGSDAELSKRVDLLDAQGESAWAC